MNSGRFTRRTLVLFFGCLFVVAVSSTLFPSSARADESKAESENSTADVILVMGAAGEKKYGEMFASWAKNWAAACLLGKAQLTTIGVDAIGDASDHDQLHDLIASKKAASPTALWLVFVGHGTFDGKAAKFNLRGVDISAKELAEWLKDSQRPTAVINCTSASGPFLSALSAPNRVIITATKSGYEHNFARYGQYLSESIADPTADLDKDGQTSLLEAHLSATRATLDFYASDGRLATEHPLIDDNADTQGTSASFFRGVRVTKKSTNGATPDGRRAHQFHLVQSREEESLPSAVKSRRDELELALVKMRAIKSTLTTDEYYQQLEPLLVELARIYANSTSR